MSKFLSLIGLDTNFSPYPKKSGLDINSKFGETLYSNRKQIIRIIEDFMNNDTFDYYYNRWFCSEGSSFEKKEIEKLHNPYGWMKKIVRELTLLAPVIGKDGFTTTNKKKKDALYSSLDQMNWNCLNEEIDETCETKGDFFAYWYYETSQTHINGWKQIRSGSDIFWENPIPKVKVLESEFMKYISYDSNYNPIGYTYEQDMIKQDIDDETGNQKNIVYKVQTIFKKGYIRVNDPYSYPDTGYRIFLNKEWESDIIRIIHVPSYKKQKDIFSQIPAVDYLDSILLLDDKTTNLSLINKYHGFPVTWTIDLDIDWDNSSIMPGGVVRAWTKYGETNQNISELKHKGEISAQEIKNKLETLVYEINEGKKNLYKIAGLIREELEEILGSTDSSRIVSQLRIMLENKFEKRSLKKADAFKPYFKSVLINTGNYSKTDFIKDPNITFKMPSIFINTSAFDDLVLKKSKILMGETSIEEEMDNSRMTEEDKKRRKDNLIKEVIDGKSDVEINNQEKDLVQNGQNSEIKVDNQMKQENL